MYLSPSLSHFLKSSFNFNHSDLLPSSLFPFLILLLLSLSQYLFFQTFLKLSMCTLYIAQNPSF
jgi:hypothetical protein